MFAAAAYRLTHIRPDRLAVRSERGLRFHAPIASGIVGIVELLFTGVRHLTHVHGLVANVQAVNAERDLRRPEKLAHKNLKPSGYQRRASLHASQPSW